MPPHMPTVCPPEYPYLCSRLQVCYQDADSARKCTGPPNTWCGLPGLAVPDQISKEGWGRWCSNGKGSVRKRGMEVEGGGTSGARARCRACRYGCMAMEIDACCDTCIKFQGKITQTSLHSGSKQAHMMTLLLLQAAHPHTPTSAPRWACATMRRSTHRHRPAKAPQAPGAHCPALPWRTRYLNTAPTAATVSVQGKFGAGLE